MSELILNDVKYTYKSKYQTVNALKGITYTFEAGKFYALIGRSGSGKTTLLSLLAYHDKTTGQLDRDLYHRDTVAVIYQSYNLLPLLSVMENVTFPLELKKTPNAKKIAEEKLRAVGLDETYFKRLPCSPVVSSSESPSQELLRATRKSSLRTSPPAIWTRKTVRSSSICCRNWLTRRAIVSSWSPTIFPLPTRPTKC